MFFKCFSTSQLRTFTPQRESHQGRVPSPIHRTSDRIRTINFKEQLAIESRETATTFNSADSCTKKARLLSSQIHSSCSKLNGNYERVKITYNRGKENEQVEEGTFYKGQLNGEGRISWFNRSLQVDSPYQKISGVFMNGKFISGTMELEDGSVEKGIYNEAEELDGNGSKVYPNGIKHIGFFVKGKLRRGKKILPSEAAYEKGTFGEDENILNGKRLYLDRGFVEVYKNERIQAVRPLNLFERLFER